MTRVPSLPTPTLLLAVTVSLLLHGMVLLLGWWPKVEVLENTGVRKPVVLVLGMSKQFKAPPLRADEFAKSHISNSDAGIVTTPTSRKGELTKAARLIEKIDQEFEWPLGAVASGKLTLRVIVGVNGRAIEVNVTDSNLPRAVEGEIVRRFYYAQYAPGEVGNRPVVSEVVVAIDLR